MRAAEPLSVATEAAAPPGYFGRALVVDLESQMAERFPLGEETLRAFLGGVGLGTKLLLKLAPARVDPLHPGAGPSPSFEPFRARIAGC